MKQRTKGICYMLCSALCFSIMNACVRLSGDIPSMQKMFFRNLISLLAALFLLWRGNIPIRVPRAQWKHLLSRSFFGTVGVVCNFYAVDHMLLSDATMLNKMSPFFALLFSAWLLREGVAAAQILLSCAALGGCVFILKPTVQGLVSPAALVALLGGLTAGLAYTEVRILGLAKVNKDLIILFFSLFSCLAALPFLIFDHHAMTAGQLGFLLLTGVAATGGQFCITSAYCCAPASEVAVYDYSQIIFAAVLGYFLFQQTPDALSVTGYVIICAAAAAMTLYNSRRSGARGA